MKRRSFIGLLADATGFVNPSGHFLFAKEKETGQFDHLGPWSPYQPNGGE